MLETSPLEVYRGMDPDALYLKFPNGSLTFIYVPESDNLYIEKYPTAHHEMLDQEDISDDVYPDKKPYKSYSRGSALEYGRAILGRIALDHMTPLIAFWNSKTPINKITVNKFLDALYKKMPLFENFKSTTVLLLPDKYPTTITKALGLTEPKMAPNPERQIAMRHTDKEFFIGGQKYTTSQLQAMRAAIHTQGGRADTSVLCHPDIEKYPELTGYRPSDCGQIHGSLRKNHPQNWRIAGREAGIPYVYAHENTFQDWIVLRDSLKV